MNKITVLVLGEMAADSWIGAGDLSPAEQAASLLAERHEGNLPVEEDLVGPDGHRVPAELEGAFAAAFWGRIEEVAQ